MSLLNAKSHRSPTAALLVAALADIVLILLFAAVGRDAHQRGDVVSGVLLTAWPFLAGAAAGWLVTRAWRDPFALSKAGLGIWLGSLAGGMLLRAATGQTVVLPFVIVAMLSLGLLLLGYRFVIALVRRRRRA
jgi:peptidoglycan/LPS O-acetylase OafA/YrhL